MKKSPRKRIASKLPQPKKARPFEFFLEALESVRPITTRPMFGCLGVYVGERIVVILRDKGDPETRQDDGIWLATTGQHHASLQQDFPSMRSISMFTDGSGPTGWQVLPVDSETFEEDAQRVCEFVSQDDPRIGKIPARKRSKKTVKKRKAR